jgi:hypothetical protein
MATVHDRINDRIRKFLSEQLMFFVGTAPLSGGHVNVSPKGYKDTFAVLDDHTVAYLDLFGSGVETIAHLQENGRITLMFCSFSRNANIIRLQGTGRVVRPDAEEFASLKRHFGLEHAGIRSVIVVDVDRIADSCGFSVPLMEPVGERPVLDTVHGRRTDEEFATRIAGPYTASIDGLPALKADHPLPSSIVR